MEKTPTFQVQAFGSYYLLERIAVGGMAEIFKAKQIGVRGFEKILVIKKILHHLSEDPEFVEMFEDEAKIAAQLSQANIVQIYELGEVEGTLYITMEYVDGKNMRDVTRSCGQRSIHLSVEQCVFFMTEVLKGLDYAHRKTDSSGIPLAIVHRDISPQNIIVSYEGEIKILDFGIAKAASKISKTEAGVLKGKFSYMSPEQASGKMITQTTDIYACGVIFHELLTSDRLFRAKSDMETLEKVKEGIIAPPSQKNSLIPPELDVIVLKSLARDSNSRYQTAGEMLNDLNRLSLAKSFRYSSQDLGAFMKALFSNTILEEKERLIDALAKIPTASSDPLVNARTHIAFKRPPASSDGASSQNQDELTFTVSRKGLFLRSPKSRRMFLGAALVVAVAFVLAILVGRSKNPEPNSSTVNAPIPTPKTDGPDSVPNPNSIQKVNQGQEVPKIPEVKQPSKRDNVESILGQVTPPPLEDSPLPKPIAEDPPKKRLEKKAKPEPTRKPEPTSVAKSNEKTFGTMDVMAPSEGFAQLFIDGKPFGTVPGPKARGIRLESGNHIVKCATSKNSYNGKIEIRGDELATIRCQDLK
ncbi:MAG: hypothetical protein JWQ35_764 [Bacteriovoracaceae bacterium]|nr:hypothetical protein [Bacteriovoracaceae bacterium]